MESLSNKNQDYVFNLEREIVKQSDKTEAEAKVMVAELLPDILEAQKKGVIAAKLFSATPKVKAEQLLHPEPVFSDVPFWQKALDNCLVYLALFAAVYGVGNAFSAKSSAKIGILSIMSMGIILGFFMTRYEKYLNPQASGTKPKWSKIITSSIIMLVVLLAWNYILVLPGINVINPAVPGEVCFVIAIIALAIRYLFKKKYQLVGSAFARTLRKKVTKD
ncbi:MAG: DUF1129 family protein [Lactobacillus sp.]|nr:DUF1129 family protein [Lactobacillus sp.]